MKIENKKVAILATNGFEKSELFEPLEALKKEGAIVDIISPESGEIKSWDDGNWGKTIEVTHTISDANEGDYHALVLPGGVINPDQLRINSDALDFVKSFYNSGKPIAAICHAPWLLVSAGLVEGKKMTSYSSIQDDVKNAGAKWEDSEVVCDQGLITSRNPDDLPAFCGKLIEEIQEGKHERR